MWAKRCKTVNKKLPVVYRRAFSPLELPQPQPYLGSSTQPEAAGLYLCSPCPPPSVYFTCYQWITSVLRRRREDPGAPGACSGLERTAAVGALPALSSRSLSLFSDSLSAQSPPAMQPLLRRAEGLPAPPCLTRLIQRIGSSTLWGGSQDSGVSVGLLVCSSCSALSAPPCRLRVHWMSS